MKKRFSTMYLPYLIIILFLLSGCSEIEKDSSLKESVVQKKITGAVVKGPISNATVKIFALNESGYSMGGALETVTTDENGHWSLTAAIDDKAHLIVASGGSFYDESDPARSRIISLQAGEKLYGILPPNETSGVVSFTTHALYRQIQRYLMDGGTFQEAFLRTQNRVTNVLGFNPFTTIPANPTNPESNASNEQLSYALMAGGQANMMNSLAVYLGREKMDYEIINAFTKDFDDCVLDARFKRVIITVGSDNSNMLIDMTLLQQIERFRNNNYASYLDLALPQFDEESLCNRAQVIAPTQETFILSENHNAATTSVEESDPQSDAVMQAYVDQVNGGNLIINLKKDKTGASYGTEISINIESSSPDKYTIGSPIKPFTASYENNGVTYHSNNEGSWGFVELTEYSDIDGYMIGRYRIKLCVEDSECHALADTKQISGYFSVIREGDYVDTSEGSSPEPHAITEIPYIVNNRHTVSEVSDSFYKIDVSGTNGVTLPVVNIGLNNLTDNVDLFVYDSDDLSTVICTSDNLAIENESCFGEFPSGFAYVIVKHLGSSHDANFDLTAMGVETHFSQKLDTNDEAFYTPSLTQSMAQSIDPRMTTNKNRVTLELSNGTAEQHSTLELSFSELTTGSYTLGSTANATYTAGFAIYDASTSATGSITITNTAVVIAGDYAVTLCRSSLDCDIPENSVTLEGSFRLPKVTAVVYESEGTSGSGVELTGTSYNSGTGYDSRLHSVMSDVPSYYQLPTLAENAQYSVTLSGITEQLRLTLSSTSDFASSLCTVSNTASSEVSCTVNGLETSSIFMQVDYVSDTGGGDVFHIDLLHQINTSSGTLAAPTEIMSLPPYTSPELLRVSSMADSSYQVAMPATGAVNIALSSLSDNVDLHVYDAADFDTLICSSQNTGTNTERCLGEFTGEVAYVIVEHVGTAHEITFNLDTSIVETYFSQKLNTQSELIYTPSGDNIMSHYIDPRVAINQQKLSLAIPNNSGAQTNTLILSVNAHATDVYSLVSLTANATYTEDGISYNTSDDISSVSVTISDVQNEIIAGHYAVTLCHETDGCTLAENRKEIVGSFRLPHGPAVAYASEGTLEDGIELAGASYNSNTGYDSRLHSVKAGEASYYDLPSLTSDTQYIVKLSQITGQVSLTLSSTRNFNNTPLCAPPTNTGSEIFCTVNGSDASSIFMQVNYADGVGGGNVFHIELMREAFDLSIDQGASTTFSDGTATSDLRAVYDNTLSSGNKMKIRLKGGSDILNIRLPNTTVTTHVIADAGSSAKLFYSNINYTASSGKITIDQFGDVDGLISGSYNLTMCPNTMTCDAGNSSDFQGNFDVVRDANRDFVSQGEVGVAYTVQPIIDFDEKYTIQGGGSISYYSATFDPGESLIFSLTEIEGNIGVQLFTDSSYYNSVSYLAPCSDTNNGQTYYSCSFNSYGSAEVFIRVTSNESVGASYLFEVHENKFSFSIDGGETLTHEEAPYSHDVSVNAWSPSGNQENVEGFIFQSALYDTSLNLSVFSVSAQGAYPYSMTELSSIEFSHEGNTYYSASLTEASLDFNIYGSYYDNSNDHRVVAGTYQFSLCRSGSNCSLAESYSNISGGFSFIPSTLFEGVENDPKYIDSSMNNELRTVTLEQPSHYMFDNYNGLYGSEINFTSTESIQMTLFSDQYVTPICTIGDIRNDSFECDQYIDPAESIFMRATLNGGSNGEFQIHLPQP